MVLLGVAMWEILGREVLCPITFLRLYSLPCDFSPYSHSSYIGPIVQDMKLGRGFSRP